MIFFLTSLIDFVSFFFIYFFAIINFDIDFVWKELKKSLANLNIFIFIFNVSNYHKTLAHYYANWYINQMKKLIFEFKMFHLKNFKIFSNNSIIIRARKKRQKVLRNKNFSKYMKTKINNRFAKKHFLQTLKQVSKYLRLSINQQTNMKDIELKKLTKKKFDEQKFDKHC